MPHREAAWALLAERLDQAAWLCQESRRAVHRESPAARARSQAPAGIATATRRAPSRRPPAGPAGRCRGPVPRARAISDAALARAADHCRTGAAASDRPMTRLVSGSPPFLAYAAVTAAGDRRAGAISCPGWSTACCGRWPRSSPNPNGARPGRSRPGPLRAKRMPDPGQTAVCSAGAAGCGADVRQSRQPAEQAAAPAVGDTTSPGDSLWQAARSATRLRTSLGQAGDCPPELAEATAALQALACAWPRPRRRGGRRRLRQHQDGLPAAIQAAATGPTW